MAKEIKDKPSLLDRMKTNSTITESSILSKSKIFDKKEIATTVVPILNTALSGELDGGLTPGMSMFAGPSKHFKTLFVMILAKAYLDKYPDGVMMIYDSEFGAAKTYFKSLRIDEDRVFWTPILDIEQLKIDLTKQIDGFIKGDHVVVVLDSIGNIASIKEVTDALNEKTVTDMSRAKALKSLFRIVPPRCFMKNIPLLVVNHTYKEQSLYPKDIVSGGTGSYYNSDNLFIIGRQAEKEGKDIEGYNFTLKTEKSRSVKEGSQFNVTVTFNGGIDKNSGLLELAIEGKFLEKLNTKPLTYKNRDGITLTEKEIEWKQFLENDNFKKFVRDKYKLSEIELLGDIDETIE